MWIKRDAFGKTAKITAEMNLLMVEWSISKLIRHKSRKLNRIQRRHMEHLKYDVNWRRIGVGLTQIISED